MKNLFKTVSLFLAAITLTLTSCKKENTDDTSPANYNEITKADIEAVANTMSSTLIIATNGSGHVLDVGDVLVYKTNDDRYGKMEILAIDDATNYKLTLKAVTYNVADSGTFNETNSLDIRGTWLCDLDALTETDVSGDSDFQWERVTATDTNLRPWNSAIFALYDF